MVSTIEIPTSSKEQPRDSSSIQLLDDGGTLLIRAAKRLRAELDAKLKPTGISACQYFLLNTLYHHGGMTQGSLSQLTGVDRTGLVSILDEIENKKWVTRNEVPEDRRANRIELTTEGLQAYERCQEIFLSQQENFLNRLSHAEIHVLNDMLRRLA
jgi:DNA-binding MarR family transcriptional regulator